MLLNIYHFRNHICRTQWDIFRWSIVLLINKKQLSRFIMSLHEFSTETKNQTNVPRVLHECRFKKKKKKRQ